MAEIKTYSLGKPFPEEQYISVEDRIIPRFTPASFDVIITLNNLTFEERKAIICEKFYVSIFVHKQIPFIVFDFGVFKQNISLNIKKVLSFDIQDWIYDNQNTVINFYLLEPVTGNIINFRLIDFPLMTGLKYLLRLQLALSKEEIDKRIHDGEDKYSIHEMLQYSIFFDEIPVSGIKIEYPTEEDLIF